MKNIYFIILIITISIYTKAQDASNILNEAQQKCESVLNGKIEFDRYFKFYDRDDTASISHYNIFKKLETDTLFSKAFYIKDIYVNGFIRNTVYDGCDLYIFNNRDSICSIISGSINAEYIKKMSYQLNLYRPVLGWNDWPLPDNVNNYVKNYDMFFEGTDSIGKYNCNLIRIELNYLDSPNSVKTIKETIRYWINKADSFPVQYTDLYKILADNDTVYQYERNSIKRYELNNTNEASVELPSIPDNYRLKVIDPNEEYPLLPINTIAPGWTLATLQGDSLSLADLKGKLVLIDFFYKSCYPCMLALPALQSLHTKYKEKGLVVVGIDPIDKKDENFPAFLSKKGVTYRVLLEGKDVAKSYKVSGYPTVYLIDRDGRIIHTNVGFDEGMEKNLEEIIIKYLQAE